MRLQTAASQTPPFLPENKGELSIAQFKKMRRQLLLKSLNREQLRAAPHPKAGEQLDQAFVKLV